MNHAAAVSDDGAAVSDESWCFRLQRDDGGAVSDDGAAARDDGAAVMMMSDAAVIDDGAATRDDGDAVKL